MDEAYHNDNIKDKHNHDIDDHVINASSVIVVVAISQSLSACSCRTAEQTGPVGSSPHLRGTVVDPPYACKPHK